MTLEDLNLQLYQKMYAEQEHYRDWLLSQPPEEIINHCYECTVRQDILFSMEEHDISEKQCLALLKLENPVADIFKDFEKRESDYMDTIRDTIECRANDILRDEFIKSRREER